MAKMPSGDMWRIEIFIDNSSVLNIYENILILLKHTHSHTFVPIANFKMIFIWFYLKPVENNLILSPWTPAYHVLKTFPTWVN